MEVIITHINADFDALASLVAARKLYPNAKVVFPGAQEKGLRDFMVRSTFYVLAAERMKDIALADITRLIIVDTRQRSRIGRFAGVVGSSGVEIHIYDHHPPSADDVRGDLEVVEALGATITILITKLQEKGIPITPQEATVMMLGIYEDTGSLTFSSTTAQDLRAAAYLLEQGADLNIVADMITRELTADQVFMLNDLIRSAERYDIKGVEVVVTTASADQYIGDVAVLVHKLKDMENLNAVFALIRMEDRVYLIARSRVAEVDVAEVALHFGGGGHQTAASATIKDLTLAEAKEQLLRILHEAVRPSPLAKELMIPNLITIERRAKLKEADEVFKRYVAISVLPVLEGDRLVGLITRDTVQRGMLHGLGEHGVAEYMNTDYAVVAGDAPLRDVQGIIAGKGQRFLPVVEGGRLVGGITRQELLRAIHDTTAPCPVAATRKRSKALVKLMQERLAPPVFSLLGDLGKAGEEYGVRVYAVGGFVRDMILGRENFDIDVVVEGDGIRFAQLFAERVGGKVKVHKRMKTAAIRSPHGYKIDVATARMEFYARPAAPPTVQTSSLKQDLFRRDFTINTLAIDLSPPYFGQLIDYFGGERDIKEGVIRVLHNLSFVEDPARIFRAIRFEQRFGFRIDKQTLGLIKGAISMGLPGLLSGRRLFAELELILREADPPIYLERLAQLRLLSAIHPELTYDPPIKTLVRRVKEVCGWFDLLFLKETYARWLVYMLALADQLSPQGFEGLVQRLQLPPRQGRRLIEARGQAAVVLQHVGAKDPSPKEIYILFRPMSTEALLFAMAKTEVERIQKAISLYFTQLRQVRVSLQGRDLKALGIKPGPIYREIIDHLLLGRLEGHIKSRGDELRYVTSHYCGGCV